MNENIVLIEENEDKTITTIKLNRIEKKNALNYDLMVGLRDAIDKVEKTNTRVVIIEGAAETFSAGIDLASLAGQGTVPEDVAPNMSNPGSFRYYMTHWFQPIFTRLETIEKPVIAKIRGYCFGAGFELALACDLRFTLESTIFSMLETKVGINPDVGGTIRLTRLVGIPNAKDLILTGRRFDGNEAYRLGVVNGVAKTEDELDELVTKYTEELIDSAPLAVGISKRLIDLCYGHDQVYGMTLETLSSSRLLRTKDANIGAIARIQRTKPKWKGR